MKAIIMAGGIGSRLRPLTDGIPKPMVPIIDKPVMECIIELLKSYEITDIGVTVGYKKEKIIDYFKDGKQLGVNLTYFIENKPLGTAGGVKNAINFIDDEILIISGDAYTDINLSKLIKMHEKYNSKVTIASVLLNDARGFGLMKFNEKGEVTSFKEKPKKKIKGYVNTGIYVIDKQIIKSIPNGFCDFSKDIFSNMKSGIYGVVFNDYWSDIGTLQSYYLTNLYVANKLVKGNGGSSFVA